ncbi:leukocyte antigen CD37-like [Puntigrus tetrazona]|uniref:leukocyte antigen CD37-like n=1 Tax=Puntigrus tetrazona TaxID=1606681 RepID=UPI001C8A0CF1|nr:leukocyte antigen CD37-like [Puntigrus tetrazona]XP_043085122.1 leukocyte antigen CD37-like [Puntigrus tetrazona]
MKMGIQICKFFLFFFNFLFLIVGLGLTCLGTYVQVMATFSGFYPIGQKTSPFSTGLTMLIIAGFLTMLLAVVSNHGACMHKTSVLNVVRKILITDASYLFVYHNDL